MFHNVMKRKSSISRAVTSGLLLACIPSVAIAYMGVGAGLSAVGSLLAVVSAVFLALVGFIWYPIKRILKIVQEAETGGQWLMRLRSLRLFSWLLA